MISSSRNNSVQVTSYDNPSFVGENGTIFENKEKDLQQDKIESTASSPPEGEDENAGGERATWSNSLEFLLSCIAMNVGLGNIWRFPFVAYENGGGAFLIPYIAVLIFLGRPMYYLEMCLGQFSSKGNVEMFESMAPVLKGIGFGQLIATFSVATYYCSLMGLTLYYLVHSFTSDLPWSECKSSWENESWLQNLTCMSSRSQGGHNYTNGSISSGELWFRIEVLKESMSIDDGIGYPDWQLTLCLLVSWAVTFAICSKGVHSSGKASYFLAVFPYVILFALLIRSATLEGADRGILFFVTPQWEKLLSAQVWYSAVTQCFFSLNIGFGSVTMYASYNGFRHNVYRDAMVVTTLDTFTSFLAGLIIFGILGNLAFKMDVEVDQVIRSGGTGLAFISYPEAIARFEAVPWLFAILFFFMLFVLGVGSQVALLGCAFTVIKDAFPHLNMWQVSLGCAVVGFAVGLVYVTPGGQYIFTMVDFFGGTFIFYVLTICEILSIAWWYGLENLCLDIEFMLKRRPGLYWRICWALVIPIVLIGVFVYFISTLKPLTYENKEFPEFVIAWGWVLFGVGILQPPIWWILYILRNLRKGGCSTVVIDTFRHDKWGPKDRKTHDKWTHFKSQKLEARKALGRHWLVDKFCSIIGR